MYLKCNLSNDSIISDHDIAILVTKYLFFYSFQVGFTVLLRVFLTEHNIRRVTVENIPDTVDDLHLILKEKPGLEGDLIIQFQDPMFNNEHCNLSSMAVRRSTSAMYIFMYIRFSSTLFL